MKTIRIHFEDLSSLDMWLSESQMEEFEKWLRFANRNDTFAVSGQVLTRKDIVRTEIIQDEKDR